MDRFLLEGSFGLNQAAEIRRFTETLVAWIPDGDARARVALAAHELFENAVKFSDDGKAALHVEWQRAPSPRVSVSTRNRAKPTDLVALGALAERMRAASDPLAFYVAVMKEKPKARGGLGIVRIAAEAEMLLDIDVKDDEVVIRAALDLPS